MVRLLDILIVEDDPLEARVLEAGFDERGRMQVTIAFSAEDALDQLAHGRFDAVVTDLIMAGSDGIELVRRIRETDATLPVFILTVSTSVERAVEGIRAGATEYLQKPVNVDALLAFIDRAIAERPLREELLELQQGRRGVGAEEHVVGDHPRLEDVRRFATRIAAVPGARVLITGESGTGKTLLARVIHELSAVRGRLVNVNCAALPAHLLESELFGHEKGAFTDARTLKRGLIEFAHEGTLFLDEIGAMPLETQAKLLLFLEDQEIRRVGGTRPIHVRTRVLAATNEDLEERVRERAFRLDLLYRLDVTSLRMPALREMPSIIPAMAQRFARDIAAEIGRPVPELDPASFDALRAHDWPGNGRELRNVVERALIFHGAGPLRIPVPPTASRAPATDPGVTLPLTLRLDEVERHYLAAFLETNEGVEQQELAARLGIVRKTLWQKRRRHGL
jgi:DNA-binding NtrC family response regulator